MCWSLVSARVSVIRSETSLVCYQTGVLMHHDIITVLQQSIMGYKVCFLQKKKKNMQKHLKIVFLPAAAELFSPVCLVNKYTFRFHLHAWMKRLITFTADQALLAVLAQMRDSR